MWSWLILLVAKCDQTNTSFIGIKTIRSESFNLVLMWIRFYFGERYVQKNVKVNLFSQKHVKNVCLLTLGLRSWSNCDTGKIITIKEKKRKLQIKRKSGCQVENDECVALPKIPFPCLTTLFHILCSVSHPSTLCSISFSQVQQTKTVREKHCERKSTLYLV
jgi:hypothetical protein